MIASHVQKMDDKSGGRRAPPRLAEFGQCIMKANCGLVFEAHDLGAYGRLAQRERRSRILATTRHLISQDGPKCLTLRQVAEKCDVSIQTIYNLVGDRSRVMAEAVIETISASFAYAGRHSCSPVRFLALSEIYWASAVAHSEYIRYATIDYFSCDQEYRNLVRARANRIYSDALLGMKRKDELLTNADIGSLAHRFSCLAAASTFDWANGSRTLEELHSDLLDGHFALLRSSLTPAVSEMVEQWWSAPKALGPIIPN